MISLITPTGDRPEAFLLCQKWMDRQTMPYDEWIIVDDGVTPSPITPDPRKRVVRLPPALENTQARNMLAALDLVKYEMIAIIEDDDWYPVDYIEWRVRALEAILRQTEKNAIVGAERQLAYDIRGQRWRRLGTQPPLSSIVMFECGQIPLLRACRAEPKYLDVEFAEQVRILGQMTDCRIMISEIQPVSMKNMPGRRGIGFGHSNGPAPWNPDPDLMWLEKFIGKDVEDYRKFCGS